MLAPGKRPFDGVDLLSPLHIPNGDSIHSFSALQDELQGKFIHIQPVQVRQWPLIFINKQCPSCLEWLSPFMSFPSRQVMGEMYRSVVLEERTRGKEGIQDYWDAWSDGYRSKALSVDFWTLLGVLTTSLFLSGLLLHPPQHKILLEWSASEFWSV